jgi:hypothetical protein
MDFTLTYSEALIRKSVKRFCMREIGPAYPVALLLGVTGLVYAILEGDRSWLTGVFGTALAIGATFPILMYRTHLSASLASFRRLDGKPVTAQAKDGTFAVSSAAGSSEFPWATITEVRRFEEFWMLMRGRAPLMTFPLDGVAEEVKAHVLERIKAAGSRVH